MNEYTLEEIKEAFISMFAGSGEWWFDYLCDEEEQKKDAESVFDEFVDCLVKKEE